jgi:hypothetical protein
MHLHIGKLYNENTTSDATCLRLAEKKRLYGASLGVWPERCCLEIYHEFY